MDGSGERGGVQAQHLHHIPPRLHRKLQYRAEVLELETPVAAAFRNADAGIFESDLIAVARLGGNREITVGIDRRIQRGGIDRIEAGHAVGNGGRKGGLGAGRVCSTLDRSHLLGRGILVEDLDLVALLPGRDAGSALAIDDGHPGIRGSGSLEGSGKSDEFAGKLLRSGILFRDRFGLSTGRE